MCMGGGEVDLTNFTIQFTLYLIFIRIWSIEHLFFEIREYIYIYIYIYIYVCHIGFLENVFVTFIDKTESQNPEKRENYWIYTLKTVVSWGLNILSSVWTTRVGTLFCFSGIFGHGRFKDKIYGRNILLSRICVYIYIWSRNG